MAINLPPNDAPRSMLVASEISDEDPLADLEDLTTRMGAAVGMAAAGALAPGWGCMSVGGLSPLTKPHRGADSNDGDLAEPTHIDDETKPDEERSPPYLAAPSQSTKNQTVK